eukprot:364737-Chlamydomonas_euryale.AAC.8
MDWIGAAACLVTACFWSSVEEFAHNAAAVEAFEGRTTSDAGADAGGVAGRVAGVETAARGHRNRGPWGPPGGRRPPPRGPAGWPPAPPRENSVAFEGGLRPSGGGGTSRSVRTVHAGDALRLPPVVLRVPQYSICPARCGFHTMDRFRAPPQQMCATAYERSRVGLSGHEPDVHMCKEASQGRHKDTIPWRWQEDEEDQQVEEEEREELPDQEKQPVLQLCEGAAAAPKVAAAAAVIDIDTNLEDF